MQFGCHRVEIYLPEKLWLLVAVWRRTRPSLADTVRNRTAVSALVPAVFSPGFAAFCSLIRVNFPQMILSRASTTIQCARRAMAKPTLEN
jgi:hypothetical protein